MLLRHIRYFIAVVDHKSFTKAAEFLYISQPTLSQQIRLLEERLGTQLFDRSGRSVRLTDTGEVFAQYVRDALLALEAGQRAVQDVANLSRGHLRLAVMPTFTSYFIGPVIEQFGRRYPGIALSVAETSAHEIEEAVLNDRVDLGIGFLPVRSDEVEVIKLFEEELGLLVGAGHPLAGQQTPVPVTDLTTQPFALLALGFATRTLVDHYFTTVGIKPQVAVEADTIGVITAVVREGRLATVLPTGISAANLGLHVLTVDPPLPRRDAVILRRHGGYQTAAARAFSAELIADMKNSL